MKKATPLDGETAEVTVMGELVMAIGFPEWVGLDVNPR